jgi:hypothetical protein
VSSENNITVTTNYNTSVTIEVYDQDTAVLLSQNATATLKKGASSQDYTVENGNSTFTNIAVGNYTVLVTSNGYSEETYDLSVVDNSTQTLKAYLTTNNNTVVFTYYDKDTSVVLDNVSVKQYRKIGGEYTLISSRYTDITGRTQFSYVSNVRYRFVSAKEGYVSKTFELDPVLFDSYFVKMEKSSINYDQSDYESVHVGYAPRQFYDGQSNSMNITFYSPTGLFNSYQYVVSYPGGSHSDIGNLPSGETFHLTVTPSGSQLTDTVNITLKYATDIGSKNYTYQAGILISPGNQTFAGNMDNTYGLGLLERLMIGTLILIIMAGLITLSVGSVWGATIGLLLMGVFIYMGFWPWWSAGISFLVGLALIAGRTD